MAVDRGCAPVDVQASLSAFIYRSHFWRGQLKAIAAEIQQLQDLPAAVERAREEARTTMTPIEQRMSRLSEQEGSTPAERERIERDQENARLSRIALLARCEQEIAGRIAR